MNKICALYTNELIKLKSKASTWILLALMIVSSFLTPIILGQFYIEGLSSYNDYLAESLTKEQVTHLRDSYSKNLGDIDKLIQHETISYNVNNKLQEVFSTYLTFNEDDLQSYENYLIYNTLLAGYDFDKYPITETYLSKYAYYEYRHYQYRICDLNSEPFDARDSEWFAAYDIATKCLDNAKKALFNHDYAPLIEAMRLDNFEDEAKRVERLSKVDLDKNLGVNEADHLMNLLNEQETAEDCIRTGTEPVQTEDGDRLKLLTSSKRNQLEERIKIIDHLFEKKETTNIMRIAAMEVSKLAQSIGRFFLIVLLIVVAGGCISQELSTGSIKSLIIAPVKRWKIFLAKFLSVLTVVIVGSLILTCIVAIGTAIRFGTENLPSYYYVSDGVVKELSFYLYSLLHFLVDNISLFIYVLLAFTISCMTKNTALSVGVSMGLILFNSLGSSFITMFGQKRWIDFLPFSNMDFSSFAFPHESLIGSLSVFESTSINNNSLLFSTAYILIMIFILMLIAYDGFVKKDIS